MWLEKGPAQGGPLIYKNMPSSRYIGGDISIRVWMPNAFLSLCVNSE